jgi:adenosylcobyric acid synthase
VQGLGLLAIETVLTARKQLAHVTGTAQGAPLRGYEMHVGDTTGPDGDRPFALLSDGRHDGATAPDGRVIGTYLHGLFASDAQRAAWLARFGAASRIGNHDALIEQTLDALAAHLEAHVDIDRLLTLAR